jgi:hypothetical protein
MPGTRKHIMRFVLALIVFQFIAPIFVSVVAQGAELNRETSGYHSPHNSIIIPMLLKEKEETEARAETFDIDFVPLIDFKDHSFVLTELHATRFTPFVYRDRYDDQPPLFTLYGAFLI